MSDTRAFDATVPPPIAGAMEVRSFPTVALVSVRFRRTGPRSVRVALDEGEAVELARLDLVQWAASVDVGRKPPDARVLLVVVVDGDGEAVGAKLVAASSMSPEKFEVWNRVRIQINFERTFLAREDFLPKEWVRSTIDTIQARDRSNSTLPQRALMFLMLDFASATTILNGDPESRLVKEARALLHDHCSGLEPLTSKDQASCHTALVSYIAALLEREGYMHSNCGNDVLEPVMKLFELLTTRRFGQKSIDCLSLDEWTGRALVADVVRFASGSMAYTTPRLTDLANCAPNGAYFAFFPTFAVLAHERARMQGNGVRSEFWTWWARATLAGLEAFLLTCDRGFGIRDFRRYRNAVGVREDSRRRLSRPRMARLVECHATLGESSFERRLEGALVYMFGDLDGKRFADHF